jgi:1-acyl-sn-glycerol-3-phosphate acyltransferase
MRTLARRLITIPGYALAFALGLAAAPLWLAAGLLAGLVRRDGCAWLRACAFVQFYLAAELAGLLAAAALWLLRPLARWDDARWRALHYRLQHAWGTALFRALVLAYDLRVQVHGARDARLGEGPYLLLVRHSSAADTLLASALIGGPHGLDLRYVLKRELLRDPCLDVVGRRLAHCFVDRASEDPSAEVAQVRALALELSRHEGVLIYPEGTRFSEARRARLLEQLAREGDAERLAYASGLRCTLPPRSGGTLALLEAAPLADVVVCAHAGFESAGGLGAVWRGALLRRTIHVAFERIPRARVPVERDARAEWLRAVWRELDAWVADRSRFPVRHVVPAPAGLRCGAAGPELHDLRELGMGAQHGDRLLDARGTSR